MNGCGDGGTVPFANYPAAYSEVIAVTSSKQDDSFPINFNYSDPSEDSVTVTAPGENILIPNFPGSSGYSVMTGPATSLSTPLVSALAGLIISMAPNNPNLDEVMVKDIVISTTEMVDPQNCPGGNTYDTNGWNPCFGYGLINAYAALDLVQSVPSTPTGFYGTGSQGQNPTLHWNSITEADIDYLELNRTVIGQLGGNRVFTLSSSATQYTDNTIVIDKFGMASIRYKLRTVDIISQPSPYTNTVSYNGEGLWKQLAESIPVSFSLQTNYPNPFNPTTHINFGLPETSLVTLRIYDLSGREIRTLVDGPFKAGYKNVEWNGRDSFGTPAASGMYFYRLDAASKESKKEYHETRKMVLLR